MRAGVASFLTAIWNEWVALMAGVIGVACWATGAAIDDSLPVRQSFFVAGQASFAVAAFRVWQAERLARIELADAAAPKLHLALDKTSSRCRQESGGHVFYGVGIVNTGVQRATNVSVRVHALEPALAGVEGLPFPNDLTRAAAFSVEHSPDGKPTEYVQVLRDYRSGGKAALRLVRAGYTETDLAKIKSLTLRVAADGPAKLLKLGFAPNSDGSLSVTIVDDPPAPQSKPTAWARISAFLD